MSSGGSWASGRPFSLPKQIYKEVPPPTFSFHLLSCRCRTCRRALLRTGPCAPESTATVRPRRLPAALHSTEPCSTPCRTPESSAMVRTREAHRYRPRAQFSTLERDGAGTSRAAVAHSPDQVTETPPALAPVSEEARDSEPPSRRYQTWVGPRAPSPEHPRPRRRAQPSKRAQTSGPGESSRSRPESSPPPSDQSSSLQLSPHTRVTRAMFSCDPIPGNVNLHAQEFHMESYYDIPALTADQRFRDSMRLIQRYSLLPFMTSRQFFYPRVVLEFYHTMTSRGVPSPLEIQFSISHLFFADDLLLFAKASEIQMETIMGCLNILCESSGQKINPLKSNVAFSASVDEEVVLRSLLSQACPSLQSLRSTWGSLPL